MEMPLIVTVLPAPTFLESKIALLSLTVNVSPAKRLSFRVTAADWLPS